MEKMADLYNIVIQGKAISGRENQEVQKNLADMFKEPPEKMERLLSGKPVIVKKRITHEQAVKITQKIKKAGAECKIVKYNKEISKPLVMEETDKSDPYSKTDNKLNPDRKPDKKDRSQQISRTNPYKTPSSSLLGQQAPNNQNKGIDEKFCGSCGKIIKIKAEICPKCGVRQRNPLSKAALLLITFFLGGIGAHKFYLGKHWQGIFYIVFCWTGVPNLIAFVEFIIYAFTSSETLQEKYSAGSGSIIIVAIAGFFVIISMVGILAAIAIPNFIAYRNKASQHSVKSELHNLLAAEQTYFAEHNIYSKSFEDLNFIPVEQDITIEIISADQNCFEALGIHSRLTDSLSVDCNGLKE